MSSTDSRKRCIVAWATPERQLLWTLELPAGATVADALEAARQAAAGAAPADGGRAGIPWDNAPVGIFGEPTTRAHVLRDGDRLEIYRPLRHDPKATRRERVRQLRRTRAR
jgi:uncharacterized protein